MKFARSTSSSSCTLACPFPVPITYFDQYGRDSMEDALKKVEQDQTEMSALLELYETRVPDATSLPGDRSSDVQRDRM